MLSALAACAAPATNGETQSDAKAATAEAPAAQPAPDANAASPAHTEATPPAKKPPRMSGPLPAEPVEPEKGPGVVDTRCKVDADCSVKNVGNCCGYYPACVNRNSPTDPKGVQAECAKKGMASVCGFQEISSCSCKQGRCESGSDPLAPSQVVQ